MDQFTGEKYRVGADIGGTFTDIVFLSENGKILTRKVPSTPDDYTRGIVNGMQEVIASNNLTGSSIAQVVHGCTVATNAVLEHTGARTGLITTEGFRDVLEIRRIRSPELYNLHWEKPLPLVPRELRLEVNERINYKGEVVRTLDIESAKACIDHLVSKGVESIAVCFLNSYVNPLHEQKIKELIQDKYPEVLVTLSSELIPVIKEYERTSEAVVNAYVRPVVREYLKSLSDTIRGVGVKAPLLLMQSSGGMMSLEVGMEKPMYIIECGPAAGVVGCAYLARKLQIPNVLTLDMGGTTTKASIMEDYQISRAAAYEVGAGISVASRLVTGGGYVIRVPSIDIAEIGAGGGSKLWVDVGGALHVGPRSAGAVPGPACYDAGGKDPTLTDANLVLGYLNPEQLAGGTVRLNASKAYEAIEKKVSKPLKMDVIDAAYGGYLIGNSNMIRAIRAVSIERGRDPRDFILFAYGGAGPMHVAALARELSIKRVAVMPNPGLFSAFGLLFADIEHHLTETFARRLDEQALDSANKTWESLKNKVMAEIEAGGYGDVEVMVEKFVDARYVGQSSELTIAVPWDQLRPEHIPIIAERFHEEHLKTYAHKRVDEQIEMFTLKVIGRVPLAKELLPSGIKPADIGIATPEGKKTRKAYFGKEHGWVETPILRIADLSDRPRKGPAIIELYDATCVVLPDCEVFLGPWGTIMINIIG